MSRKDAIYECIGCLACILSGIVLAYGIAIIGG